MSKVIAVANPVSYTHLYSMCDTNGIFLGVNDINHSATLVDIFNSDLYRNANMAILGSSGSGKTFTTQCMSEKMCIRDRYRCESWGWSDVFEQR